jgi:hypothetical protein
MQGNTGQRTSPLTWGVEVTEPKAEYNVETSEGCRGKRYTPWACKCGQVLGYTYRDASHITRLLVSRGDGTVYHIKAATVFCPVCSEHTEFYLDPKLMEN